jgi:hypothetical protein
MVKVAIYSISNDVNSDYRIYTTIDVIVLVALMYNIDMHRQTPLIYVDPATRH